MKGYYDLLAVTGALEEPVAALCRAAGGKGGLPSDLAEDTRNTADAVDSLFATARIFIERAAAQAPLQRQAPGPAEQRTIGGRS